MDNPFKSPAILSLCTGMRGLERGIERAIGDTRTVAYVEIEAFIIENLVKQMEQGVLDPAPVFSNLKTFRWERFRGKVHGITGGYPCQPFSVAGKQKGTEDPRHLWPFIYEGIRAIRPIWCFFENVPGHLNLGYEQVKSDLEGLGYIVKEGIYSAEEVGAPNRRERLFILAILDDARLQRQAIKPEQTTGIIESSLSELDNSDSGEQGSRRSYIEEVLEFQKEKRESKFSAIVPGGTSVEMGAVGVALGNANGTGLPIPVCSELRGIQQTKGAPSGRESGRANATFSRDQFPAGQGMFQYDWEPARVKSRMGFMLNGYSFRGDLLRMAGNGVVEQTAELAFRDLLRKHYEA